MITASKKTEQAKIYLSKNTAKEEVKKAVPIKLLMLLIKLLYSVRPICEWVEMIYRLKPICTRPTKSSETPHKDRTSIIRLGAINLST